MCIKLLATFLSTILFFTPSDALYGSLPAEPGQFPYYAFVNSSRLVLGSGAIISSKAILSAYLVTKDSSVDYMTVTVGSHVRDEGDVYKVRDVIRHPLFHERDAYNDLAVIILEEEIVFNDLVQVIELGSVGGEENVTIIGYGLLFDSEFLQISPEQLMYMNTTSLSIGDCLARYQRYGNAEYICTETVADAIGGCSDSGDPVVSDDGKLVGIFHGEFYGGCATGAPDSVTRVEHYSGWIDAVVNSI